MFRYHATNQNHSRLQFEVVISQVIFRAEKSVMVFQNGLNHAIIHHSVINPIANPV